MSLVYIRNYYRVPAREGVKVDFAWPKGQVRTGTIVGADDSHLLVDFGGERPEILHPTWEVTYREETVNA
jgi:hypothetical protein